ncbi:MAG: c-type cytochrome [Oligoflexales bacterium]|nr:c-type cytochrome [Oligoflexales bacterium]
MEEDQKNDIKSGKKDWRFNEIRVHESDGIQEYDNPLPRWWVGLFWFTIVIGVIYAVRLHFFGGESLIAKLESAKGELTEMQAQSAASSGATGDLAQRLSSASYIESGAALYAANCAACHAADGGGTIGPNLTDDYYIHGHSPEEITKVINGGVLEKGMPAWGAVLGQQKVEQLAAFVISLHGKTPAQAKSPQGKLAASAVESSSSAVEAPATEEESGAEKTPNTEE